MQLNAREVVAQFAHVLQLELFPLLESSVGPLSEELQLLAAVMALVPLDRLLLGRRARTGRAAERPHGDGNGLHRQRNYETAQHAAFDFTATGG